jgi:NagD protein
MLRDVRGFMFDLDGTLVQRGGDGGLEPVPGAVEVVAAIRRSGRPLVIFTNASHALPAQIAARVTAAGIDLREDEVLTPISSATTYLARRYPGAGVYLFGSAEARSQLELRSVHVVDDAAGAAAVLVAHVDHVELEEIERAAWAVIRGAGFLTANYARAYAGADGPILSRGAMVTAAIAKASGRRPTIVGKPSRVAIAEVGARLGLPLAAIAVVGDDLGMDIALGRLGGTRTVLVGTGISGTARAATHASRAPEISLAHVGELLPLL